MCIGRVADTMLSERSTVFILILLVLVSSVVFATESVEDEPPARCSGTSSADGDGTISEDDGGCIPQVDDEEPSDGDLRTLSLDNDDEDDEVIDTTPQGE